ncbi:uncharacterized protein LOC128213853 [Mya arenaria]|uniref:uncharacterized protein LOC128213853 n=1 Tax=Mya arenaria TaxID=6604 RepID=UPI0022DE9AE9|nr:uncharacterized protein LOC128213853 [Mya arenaria]
MPSSPGLTYITRVLQPGIKPPRFERKQDSYLRTDKTRMPTKKRSESYLNRRTGGRPKWQLIVVVCVVFCVVYFMWPSSGETFQTLAEDEVSQEREKAAALDRKLAAARDADIAIRNTNVVIDNERDNGGEKAGANGKGEETSKTMNEKNDKKNISVVTVQDGKNTQELIRDVKKNLNTTLQNIKQMASNLTSVVKAKFGNVSSPNNTLLTLNFKNKTLTPEDIAEVGTNLRKQALEVKARNISIELLANQLKQLETKFHIIKQNITLANETNLKAVSENIKMLKIKLDEQTKAFSQNKRLLGQKKQVTYRGHTVVLDNGSQNNTRSTNTTDS